jgi:hypothetical protein
MRAILRQPGEADGHHEFVLSRRRSYAQRKARKAFWQFARDVWPALAVFSCAIGAVVAYGLLFEPSDFMQGLTLGVVSTTFAAVFFVLFLVVTGTSLTLAGSWAENFANDEIKRAVRRGHVWGWVENIEVGGFDIDHVVVAPGGVLAIETKAHPTGFDNRRAMADLDQAVQAARKTASVLRSRDIDMPAEVVPVLALWGHRKVRESLPSDGRVVRDVHVVAIADLADWLARFNKGRVAQDNAEQMLQRLRRFRDTRELRDPVLR